MLILELRRFLVMWVSYSFVQGLCLMAKEKEQGVTITLFITKDNVTKYTEQSDWSSYLDIM